MRGCAGTHIRDRASLSSATSEWCLLRESDLERAVRRESRDVEGSACLVVTRGKNKGNLPLLKKYIWSFDGVTRRIAQHGEKRFVIRSSSSFVVVGRDLCDHQSDGPQR